MLTLGLLAGVAEPVAAQADIGIGAVYNNDVVEGTWGIEGRLGYPVRTSGGEVLLMGAYDYLFPDCGAVADCSFWEVRGDFLLLFDQNPPMVPYIGLGMVYSNFSAEGDIIEDAGDDIGLDLIAGLGLPFWNFRRPYIDVRYSLMSDTGNTLSIGFGVVLSAGSRN
ncbi:MAG: hypothetical protein ACR2QM_13845 [Longimicrobiales bacterium]